MKLNKMKRKNLKGLEKKARVYLKNVLARIPGSIYWKDRNGVYLGCNDFQAKMAGLKSAEDVVGKTDFDFPWKKIAANLRETDSKIMETGKSLYLEETPTLADGRQITMLTCKSPLKDEHGNIIGIIGTSIDITELKRAQEALNQANRSIEYITTVSHEIRNPLSNVISLQRSFKEQVNKLQDIFHDQVFNTLNELDKSNVAEEIAASFEQLSEQYFIANREAQRSLDALENVGDLYRMQLQGTNSRFELNNIKNLLEESIDKSTYPNQGKVNFELVIDTSVPEEAIIDYSNIRVALSIFIGNAIRFSHDKGRVKIKVNTQQNSELYNLIISIQDFGEGISESQLKNLFISSLVAGQQNQESIYRKPSIRLSQAKMFIEASGGTLEIKSALKQGTTVYVSVPYRLPQDKHQVQENHKENLKAKTLQKSCHILLVEDDPIIQKVTNKGLEMLNQNYKVNSVANGADAIKMALQNDYDVILLDISLPDMNGLEVMRKVREQKMDKSIFIAVTSHASEDDEDYFISEGAMTVLKKPVTGQQLKKAIEAALSVKANLNN